MRLEGHIHFARSCGRLARVRGARRRAAARFVPVVALPGRRQGLVPRLLGNRVRSRCTSLAARAACVPLLINDYGLRYGDPTPPKRGNVAESRQHLLAFPCKSRMPLELTREIQPVALLQGPAGSRYWRNASFRPARAFRRPFLFSRQQLGLVEQANRLLQPSEC